MNNPHPSSMARRSFRTISIARMRVTAGLAAIVGLGVAAVTMASCTVDGGARPRPSMNGVGGEGSSGSSSSGDPAGPCVDGTKSECHETVGTNGDILTCLNGERTCVGGVWGPCAGEFSSKSMPGSNTESVWAPGEYRPLGFSDAGPCQNNPCDPYCQDFEEVPPLDAGYEVVPEITTVWYAGSFDELLDGLPGGFADKGVKTPCSTALDCQFDSHCLPTGTNGITCEDGAANCCMPWNPNEYAMCSPAKPDVSPGLACEKPDGTRIIPICNRGNAPLDRPVTIYVFPGNSSQFPLCEPDKDPEICSIPAGPAIQPGQCIEVSSCAAYLPGNGVRTIMVNGPLMAAGTLPDNPDWKDECLCENNWTVWKGTAKSPCSPVQVYQANPVVKNLVYQGICPSGTQVQWGYLTWDATTPVDSNVLWDARVATTNAGLSAASYINLGTANATPAPDTQICSMAGPTGCPINLYTTLGTPDAHSEFLELRITMNPTSDKTQGAKVNNWQITYSCPPAQ